MRGWREGDDHHGRRRSDMLFFLEEKIHNRPEISERVHTHVPERGAQNTHTIQDPLRMVRQAGGRKGWRVLPPAQKTKKMKSRNHFSYLSEVYKMSEVCKITRTIQNRFDMGGRVRTKY